MGVFFLRVKKFSYSNIFTGSITWCKNTVSHRPLAGGYRLPEDCNQNVRDNGTVSYVQGWILTETVIRGDMGVISGKLMAYFNKIIGMIGQKMP